MITQDKRRDSGEYYPGGRVIARPGTAPQQVVVQWSDVQNKPQVAPLPERYKDSDMKTKINEIASKFATVVVAAFVVWTACADVTVQKKRKDEIYNDELVVVDVSGEGVGINTNAVEQIANVAVMTNALTVATTNRVAALETATNSLTSSVSGLQSSKADKSTTYTKSETDAKLAGKFDKVNGAEGGNIVFFGSDGWLADLGIPVTEFQAIRDEMDVVFGVKADRPASSTSGNLASLTADGDLEDSGIAAFDVPTVEEVTETSIREANFAIDTYDTGTAYPERQRIEQKADDAQSTADEAKAMINATDQAFSNAVMGVASHTNADFAAEVLAVQVASLSTNITAEVYIAATNACANLGIDPALVPGVGTTGTVGGFIAMLFAVVFWTRKKIFDNSGEVNDTFAGELLGKQVAKETVRYAFDSPTSSTTTTGTVETTAVTANSNTVASVTIPAAASGNTPSLAITVPDALGPSDVRDLIVYAVNADTANDCPIGIVGGTPVPQDGAEAKVPKGSRVYIAISKMPTTGEWFIQAVKLTAAA